MNRPLVVINIVGLTPAMIGAHTPNLAALASDGFMTSMQGVFPAVTATAQASMLTGLMPRDHGIVGNGWYFRDQAEIWFWRQANQLMQGEKVWSSLRRTRADATCAQLFWWYNMYAAVDWSLTLRPIYPADGRKIPALYSAPQELQQSLQLALGEFPMFEFWGPRAGIRSSDWIARATAQVFQQLRPDLTLCYLPHLDYNLQRLGPDAPAICDDLRQIDRVAGGLIDAVRGGGARVLVVSEYGIEKVLGQVSINRELRQQGWLRVRETLGWEMLDAGASDAFAVVDHQIAHVYVREAGRVGAVRRFLESLPGVERVLGAAEKPDWGMDHERSGELIALAEPGHWFSYYYWLDPARAPDFAPTVDIHRKPGYDPVELFVDPDIALPGLKVAWRLLQKKLGMRMLMDLIPLRPELVKGTHGRPAADPSSGPVLIGSEPAFAVDGVAHTDIKNLILKHLGC